MCSFYTKETNSSLNMTLFSGFLEAFCLGFIANKTRHSLLKFPGTQIFFNIVCRLIGNMKQDDSN